MSQPTKRKKREFLVKAKKEQREIARRRAAKERSAEKAKLPPGAAAVEASNALFQGQLHPKKLKKIVRLEQWVEVRVRDGVVTTTLYPDNTKLITRGQKMLPPPEFIYRRINFPDGIPSIYDWVGVIDERHRKLGGCGLQRMTVDTWLEHTEKEKLEGDGHLLPIGNLPRPRESGGCDCQLCKMNQEILDASASAQV